MSPELDAHHTRARGNPPSQEQDSIRYSLFRVAYAEHFGSPEGIPGIKSMYKLFTDVISMWTRCSWFYTYKFWHCSSWFHLMRCVSLDRGTQCCLQSLHLSESWWCLWIPRSLVQTHTGSISNWLQGYHPPRYSGGPGQCNCLLVGSSMLERHLEDLWEQNHCVTQGSEMDPG